MNKGEISRRVALKYFGLLAASAAGREFLASWLPISVASAEAEAAPTKYVPHFFKPEQLATVKLLAEMILPTDDEPGANEAKVADYIDFVVFSAREFEPSMQREWIEGLAFLDRESQKQFGKPFRSSAETDRVKLLA